MARSSSPPSRSPLAWVSGAGLAGILLAATDQILLILLGGTPQPGALVYAASIDLLAGLILGSALALLALAWRWKSGRVLAFVAIAAAVWYLNAPLFDGERIRRLSYMPVLRLVTITVLSLAVWATIGLLRRIECGGSVSRGLLRFGYLLAIPALGLANLGWGPFSRFNAYEAFKLEASVGALVLGAALFAPLTAGLPRRPLGRIVLPFLLLGLALLSSTFIRGRAEIHPIRSAIRSAPFAATLRLADPIETNILDRFGELPEIRFRDVDIDLAGLDVAAASKVQEELDRRAPERRQMNVLWIAVDALRADHLGSYGYTRATSPEIDALAAESVVFERNVTPTPASNLAYSAALNGVLGRSSPAYYEFYSAPSPVPEEYSVADIMRRGGRLTEAVTSFWKSTQDRPDFAAMKAGFDRFNADGHKEELEATRVTDLVLHALEGLKTQKQPFFLFAHYIDPHAPYSYHEEYGFDGDRTALGAYDSEIAYCDAQIGRLLDGLNDMELSDDTIVVLFADHGESFGEHNDWRHGASLREHQTHVPLIVRIPGVEPKRISQWTSLADLVPTTLALIGVADPHQRQGRDLSPLIVDENSGWLDYAYAERPNKPTAEYRSKERTVWSGDLKMSWEPTANSYRVHDLANDPRELVNVFDPDDEDQGRLIALLRRLDRRIDGFWSGGTSTPTIDEESQPATEVVDELAQSFEAAVGEFEKADDPAAGAEALAKIVAIVKSKGVAWNPRHHGRFGAEKIDRLKRRVEAVLPKTMADAKSRDLLARLLIFTDSESSVSLLEEVTTATRNRWLILQISLFRARKGDQSVRPLLQAGYEVADVDSRFQIAAALNRLGDETGRELLRAVVWSSSQNDSILAISALAAGGDVATQYQYLISDDSIWKKPSCEAALLKGAEARRDLLGDAVLVNLASSGGPEVAARARTLLAERQPDADPDRRRQLYGALFQARESIRYKAWPDAVAAFRNFEDRDLNFVGPYWLVALRAGLVCRDEAAVTEFRDRLKRAGAALPFLSEMEERSRRALGDSLERSPVEIEVEARIASVAVGTEPTKGSALAIELELENGATYLFGGDLRGSLYLAIAERDAKGAITGYRSQRPLPIDGLMPGETRRVNLWTRIPAVVGAWQPEIVLIRNENERAPKILATLSPIEIENR